MTAYSPSSSPSWCWSSECRTGDSNRRADAITTGPASAMCSAFVYVGIYWNNHHHMLLACQKVSGQVLWANLHLLFWLSLLPFATHWMGEAPAPHCRPRFTE